MNDLQFINTVSLGNILTILSFIGTVVVFGFTMISKMSKFIAITEMKFAAGDKKFTEIDTRIGYIDKNIKDFIPKNDIDKIEYEVKRMDKEQVILRAELPNKEWYKNIEIGISEMKSDIKLIKEKVFE